MSELEVAVRPWEKLSELIDSGDGEAINAYLSELPSGESSRAISRLDEAHQSRLFTSLAPGDAAGVLELMPDAQAAALVERLEPVDAAAILEELASDVRADLLVELSDAPATAILAALPEASAEEARTLASYDSSEAGGMMITEYLRYPLRATVADVLADLRANAETYADYDVQYAYVITDDDAKELAGVLRLRDLLLAPGSTPVFRLMIRKPVSVQVHATLDELRSFFREYAFFGVPVVDEAGTLVGVVRRSDVHLHLEDRADRDLLKMQGIVGGEELRSMPLVTRSRRRLSWLSISIVLNIMAASVIAFYQDTLAAVISLAVFLPIISDMSGCSGSQSVAVSMRELTLGLIRPHELMRVLGKELTLGLVNGLVLGVLIASAAWLWKGNPWVGLVVGSALGANTILAVCLGGCIPLVLKRLKFDPALASGPILTTVTDMCGFFLVLSIATAMLPKLTGG